MTGQEASYDSHTEPLGPARMKQASGTVLVENSDDPSEIPLRLSRDARTLEAALDSETKLPVTLTLPIRFPGMARDAKPELFTFAFREHSKPGTTRLLRCIRVEGAWYSFSRIWAKNRGSERDRSLEVV